MAFFARVSRPWNMRVMALTNKHEISPLTNQSFLIGSTVSTSSVRGDFHFWGGRQKVQASHENCWFLHLFSKLGIYRVSYLIFVILVLTNATHTARTAIFWENSGVCQKKEANREYLRLVLLIPGNFLIHTEIIIWTLWIKRINLL